MTPPTKPELCPTCGSDDPTVRHYRWIVPNSERGQRLADSTCRDSWHTQTVPSPKKPLHVLLQQRGDIDDLTTAGDYCFDSTGRVILACPICGTVFLCTHEIRSRTPLELWPSVVGPDAKFSDGVRLQVLPPCLHHFWVKNGIACD
jgi:hypothetical protein